MTHIPPNIPLHPVANAPANPAPGPSLANVRMLNGSQILGNLGMLQANLLRLHRTLQNLSLPTDRGTDATKFVLSTLNLNKLLPSEAVTRLIEIDPLGQAELRELLTLDDGFGNEVVSRATSRALLICAWSTEGVATARAYKERLRNASPADIGQSLNVVANRLRSDRGTNLLADVLPAPQRNVPDHWGNIVAAGGVHLDRPVFFDDMNAAFEFLINNVEADPSDLTPEESIRQGDYLDRNMHRTGSAVDLDIIEQDRNSWFRHIVTPTSLQGPFNWQILNIVVFWKNAENIGHVSLLKHHHVRTLQDHFPDQLRLVDPNMTIQSITTFFDISRI